MELRINSGGKLPNFGFVVFDDSEPVQKVLNHRVSTFASMSVSRFIFVLCMHFACVYVCILGMCSTLRGEKSGETSPGTGVT